MKEVTRIHIAKTSYDIELTAKKELEKYIHSLEAYAQDSEVIQDIEIRITELLVERDVPAGGVISLADVKAIREQLGEPYEFAGDDGDIAVGAEVDAANGDRRLYRDMHNAIAGGVLSGIAAYFKVNPLWTRIVFIVLLLMSFGAAIIVYIVLWIVVPPAKTATEKLQLEGKPVTAESIRSLNADTEPTPASRSAKIVQKTLLVAAASLSFLIALLSLGITIWAFVVVMFNNQGAQAVYFEQLFAGQTNWEVWVAFWLLVACGVLLTVLFSVIGYAFAGRVVNRRIVTTIIVVVVLGVASFSTVLGIAFTQAVRMRDEARALMRDTDSALPKGFENVNTIEFNISGDNGQAVAVNYQVDQTSRYELHAPLGTKPVISITGQSATVSINSARLKNNLFYNSKLTIYGPKMDSVVVKNGAINYQTTNQTQLNASTAATTQLNMSGTIDTVNLNTKGDVDLGGATITNLKATLGDSAELTAGTIKTLQLEMPEVCADAQYNSASVSLRGVVSGVVNYNGVDRPAASYKTTCAQLHIGENSYDDATNYDGANYNNYGR